MKSRAHLYVIIAMLSAIQQGAKPVMSGFEIFQLTLSTALAGLIVYRAYIDQTAATTTEPMKPIKTAVLSTVAVFLALSTIHLFTGCATTTNANGSKTTTLTPAAQTELANIGNATAKAVGNAIVIGVANTSAQYLATGKVNSQQLVNAELGGLAANAQAYVGQVIPSSVLVASASTPAVQQALANQLPPTLLVTQSTVNALNSLAATNVSPAGPSQLE
jgi:hypothetical protein